MKALHLEVVVGEEPQTKGKEEPCSGPKGRGLQQGWDARYD